MSGVTDPKQISADDPIAQQKAFSGEHLTKRKMRILVTGGAGFVGAHLCEKLLEEGHDVMCLDSFVTGTRENVKHLCAHPNFELIRHDIREPIQVECDQIYSLACPAAPIHYQADPIKTFQTAVVGAMNCLELARHNHARILLASTSEVYGDPEVHPQVEEYRGNVSCHGPRACYDEGKRAAEAVAFDYFRVHGVEIRVVRIFNTYGPKMHPYDGRVISNFVCQALHGKDITLYGDGTQTRSFQYISDLITGMIKMMENDTETGPINMGNPGEYTMNELAEKIVAKTHSKSKIVHLPLPTDDPTKRKPDITKAKALLNWEPVVPLDEGLDKTIEYFKNLDYTLVRFPREYYNDSVLTQK